MATLHLWLMRHGLAEDEAIDPRQPLSAEGRRQVEAVARVLGALGERPGHIVHSGKLRAQQTAEIAAAGLGMRAEHALGLNPNDVVEPWVPRVTAEDLMIVGHLPFLAKLAAELIGEPAVQFVPAEVVRLEHDRAWHVVWALTPELAEAVR